MCGSGSDASDANRRGCLWHRSAYPSLHAVPLPWHRFGPQVGRPHAVREHLDLNTRFAHQLEALLHIRVGVGVRQTGPTPPPLRAGHPTDHVALCRWRMMRMNVNQHRGRMPRQPEEYK